jgi:hypothetical protein
MRLTIEERNLALAYRQMVRRARRRGERRGRMAVRPFRAREISKDHKAAVAQLPCIVSLWRDGIEVYGVQVAHLRFSNAAIGARSPGLQRKPDDRWTLPLLPSEHRLQHQSGEREYWARVGLDPHTVARAIWEVSPNLDAMLAVIRAISAEVKMPDGAKRPIAEA